MYTSFAELTGSQNLCAPVGLTNADTYLNRYTLQKWVLQIVCRVMNSLVLPVKHRGTAGRDVTLSIVASCRLSRYASPSMEETV